MCKIKFIMRTLDTINQIISKCENTFELIGRDEEINDNLFFYDDLDAEWNSGKSLSSIFDETIGLDEFPGSGYYINPIYDNDLPPLKEVELWYGEYNDPVFGDVSINVLKCRDDIIASNYSCD